MKQHEFLAKLEKFLQENAVTVKPYIELVPQYNANPNEKYSEASYVCTNIKLQLVTRFE